MCIIERTKRCNISVDEKGGVPGGGSLLRNEMKKTVSICFLFIMLLFGSLSAAATPGTVSGWDSGNTWDLVYVTNPGYSGGTVAESYCAVSGWAVPGAVVSLYRANGNGVFEWATGGSAVGGSGMFFMPVWLNTGRNSMVVRAELGDGRYQQVRCDVILIGQGFSFPAR